MAPQSKPVETQAADSGKPEWTRPEARFYDIDAVRAQTTGTNDNSGNSAGSLS